MPPFLPSTYVHAESELQSSIYASSTLPAVPSPQDLTFIFQRENFLDPFGVFESHHKTLPNAVQEKGSWGSGGEPGVV